MPKDLLSQSQNLDRCSRVAPISRGSSRNPAAKRVQFAASAGKERFSHTLAHSLETAELYQGHCQGSVSDNHGCGSSWLTLFLCGSLPLNSFYMFFSWAKASQPWQEFAGAPWLCLRFLPRANFCRGGHVCRPPRIKQGRARCRKGSGSPHDRPPSFTLKSECKKRDLNTGASRTIVHNGRPSKLVCGTAHAGRDTACLEVRNREVVGIFITILDEPPAAILWQELQKSHLVLVLSTVL